jgi:iron complex transport system substrate-binding protein
MDRRIAAARASAPNPAVKSLLYESAGYTVFGGITDELMRAGGLVNMAPEMRPTRQSTIPLETIVARAPELLLINTTAPRANSRARQILDHPALTRLDATTARKWVALPELLCPGPWSARAAEAFASSANEARNR